jgi:hypothetical protein
MMKLCKERNVALVDQVQRTLFWRDLISCLMAGTTRLLGHKDFQDFRCARSVELLEPCYVPSGLMAMVIQWPDEKFTMVIQELHALCGLVDTQCGPEDEPLDVFPIDNDQANLESRFFDLLSAIRRFPYYTYPVSESVMYPIYEAVIFAGHM